MSDPPGIPLYTIVGLDKKAGGLTIYRCARGTNATEGGVHKDIRARLPKCGASLRHVNAALHDFVLYHNLSVCENPFRYVSSFFFQVFNLVFYIINKFILIP